MSAHRLWLPLVLLSLLLAPPALAFGRQDADRWSPAIRELLDVEELREAMRQLRGDPGVAFSFFSGRSPSAADGSAPGTADGAQALPQGEKVTLDFDGPLSQGIREIARQGGLSVIVRGKLDQPVRISLSDMPAGQTLEVLAEEHGLSLIPRGELILVAPRRSGVPAPPPPPSDILVEIRRDGQQGSRLSPVDLGEARDGSRGRGSRRTFMVDGGRPTDLFVRGSSQTVAADQMVKDVLVFGGSLDLEGRAIGDVLVFGGDATVLGSILGDALVFGGQMEVEGEVYGDILVMGGNVELGPEADVRGSVRALGGRVNQADGARVRGVAAAPEKPVAVASGPGFFSKLGSWLSTLLTRFLILFGLGFLAFMLAPARMRVLSQDFKARPGSAMGLGFFTLLALVPFFILLCITIVGIPVALLLIPLVPLAVAMGVTAIAQELGRRMPLLQGRQKTQASALALGLIPIVFASTLPVVGPLSVFLLSLIALGSVVRTRVGSRGRDPLPTNIG